jgi:hypothetical protein
MKVRWTTPGGGCLLGLATTVVALVGLALTGDETLIGGQRDEAQTAGRPNFVFVTTDDVDERSMEKLGGIRTIMNSNGTTFNNAYVTYSLCCPSRASTFRGQYPHNHGVLGLDTGRV